MFTMNFFHFSALPGAVVRPATWLIQGSVWHRLPGFSTWVEVVGIVSSLCPEVLTPQAISLRSVSSRRSRTRGSGAIPHDVPREQALILAVNHQRVLGHQTEIRVL